MGETNIYVYLTPLALIFIALEMFFSWYYRKGYISFQEAVANFGTALGNQTMNVLVAAGVYVAYGYLWENFRLLTIEVNVLTFILLLLGVDFIFYWVHRWGHAINIMWAAHSPHHSAEEMNFFVALRASVTQRLTSFLFFWPLTLIGFHPAHIYMMAGIHLFIAFLHHTEFIPKLWRPIEFVFTTPSHHRVHHGVNFKYLDKNFGEFLIIWDRIFGSFEEEQEKVVYGIYDHPRSWNPISINFHFYLVLLKLAIAAPNWWDKVRIWFMPTGWRPRGLEAPPKIEITTENQAKFRPTMFSMSRPYLAVQVAAGIALMMGIISDVFEWGTAAKWIGAFLLWWQIVNWAGIMEARKWLWVSEILRLAVTFSALAVMYGDTNAAGLLIGAAAFTAACALWTLAFFRPGASRLSFASFR
ncbi:MAG: sterol desaturase family protein [Acidobacteriota bacterium]|nr:MAG: sterol desaturase family protein [Acidobacteriota bacterium]